MPALVNFGRGHRFAAYPRCSTPAVGVHDEAAAAPGVDTARVSGGRWTGCAAAFVSSGVSDRGVGARRGAGLEAGANGLDRLQTTLPVCAPARCIISEAMHEPVFFKRRSHGELAS
jgi:hypothetical protein